MDDCPLCGSPLEKGFLNTVRALFWDTRIHKGVFSTAGGEEIIPLRWTGVQNVEAYRCRKCRLVMFKYKATPQSPQQTRARRNSHPFKWDGKGIGEKNIRRLPTR